MRLSAATTAPLTYRGNPAAFKTWIGFQPFDSRAAQLWRQDEWSAADETEMNRLWANSQAHPVVPGTWAQWKAFFPLPEKGVSWEQRLALDDTGEYARDFARFQYDPGAYIASISDGDFINTGFTQIGKFGGYKAIYRGRDGLAYIQVPLGENGEKPTFQDYYGLGLWQGVKIAPSGNYYVLAKEYFTALSKAPYTGSSQGALEKIFSAGPAILASVVGGMAFAGAFPGVNVATGEFIEAGASGFFSQVSQSGLLDSFSFNPSLDITDVSFDVSDLPSFDVTQVEFPSLPELPNLLPNTPNVPTQQPFKLPSLENLLKQGASLVQKLLSGDSSPSGPGTTTGANPPAVIQGPQPQYTTAGVSNLPSGLTWPILLAAGMGLAIVTRRNTRPQRRRIRRQR